MILIFLSLISFLFNLSIQQTIILPDSLASCKGITLTSTTPANKFGYSIDTGDINGDGIPDIIASNYPSTNIITLYIIYGKSTLYTGDISVDTMTSSTGFRITNLEINAGDNPNFLSIGDVDGDGIADIVIGATLAESTNGAIYVIYGKEGTRSDLNILTDLTDVQVGFKIIGVEAGAAFGRNINAKGDINGDTINDIVIGASRIGFPNNYGMTYVVYGQQTRGSGFTISSLAPPKGYQITGYYPSFMGNAIGSAGDFNGDKIDDFIINAPTAASAQAGIVYVVYGKSGTATSKYPEFARSSRLYTDRNKSS